MFTIENYERLIQGNETNTAWSSLRPVFLFAFAALRLTVSLLLEHSFSFPR